MPRDRSKDTQVCADVYLHGYAYVHTHVAKNDQPYTCVCNARAYVCTLHKTDDDRLQHTSTRTYRLHIAKLVTWLVTAWLALSSCKIGVICTVGVLITKASRLIQQAHIAEF